LESLSEKDFNRGSSNLSTYLTEVAIFKKVTELEKANRPISSLTVMAKLDEHDKEKANAIFQVGQEESTKLRAQNVSVDSVLDNWKSLKKKAELRAVLSEGIEHLQGVRVGGGILHDSAKEPSQIIQEVQVKLDRLGMSQDIPTVDQRKLNEDTFVSLMSAPPPCYPTGFDGIDRRIDGFSPKRTYVVAARTGQGKSALLLNMLANVAKQDVAVGFISLEMSKEDMNKRLWCITGQVEARSLRHPLSPEMQQRCRQIHQLIAPWPIFWSDKRGMTLGDLRSKVSQFARQGCKVVFVDHIQAVVGDSKEPRNLQVALVARTLANLADKLDIAIVMASQTNREGIKENKGAPELHNLAESTVIEDSADVIITMGRKEDATQGYNCPIKVYVGKNRHGATGYFDMYYRGREFRFSEHPFSVPSGIQAQQPKQSGRRFIPTPVPIPEVRVLEERRNAEEEARALQN